MARPLILAGRRGFSLSELILAMGLLALAILALVGVFTAGLTWMSKSEAQATANGIASELLEAVRADGGYSFVPEEPTVFDGRRGDAAVDGFPPAPYPAVELGGRLYHVTVRVQPHPSLPGVRAMRVEVFWDETGRTVLETAFGT